MTPWVGVATPTLENPDLEAMRRLDSDRRPGGRHHQRRGVAPGGPAAAARR